MTGSIPPAKGSGVGSGGSTGIIRVGVVDDQTLVRGGLTMLVDSQADLEVVFEASSGDEALNRASARTADVILMDVRMPGMDGLEATRRLLGDGGTATRVIVLTTFDLDEYVLEAIRVGASGFLLKDARPEVLLEAIRTVHRGDSVIAPSMTRRLLDHVVPLLDGRGGPAPSDDALTRRIGTLTEREHEVFLLMAAARSNAEIAAGLHLSEATVKTHVAHILTKLEARDRVQAVVVAYEAGIVGPRSSHPGG